MGVRIRWIKKLLMRIWYPIQAQEVLFKCINPKSPLRFASTVEERDSMTPPCQDWGQIRAPQLGSILEALGEDRFSAATVFLAEASDYSDFSYPVTASGLPITTSQLYENPTEFGFRVAPPDSAAAGAIVVYDGLAGILVEYRMSNDAPWSPKVLYPSASGGFELTVADLNIPGKLPPRVLVPSKGGPV